MKLLLDTHIWLWTQIDPKRLRHRVTRLLKDPHNEMWLSPVSTWEALALHEKGRVELDGTLTEWVSAATLGFKEAFLTHEIALASLDFSAHKDPSDRLIAATAKVLNLTLVTADEHLLGLPGIKTLANS